MIAHIILILLYLRLIPFVDYQLYSVMFGFLLLGITIVYILKNGNIAKGFGLSFVVFAIIAILATPANLFDDTVVRGFYLREVLRGLLIFSIIYLSYTQIQKLSLSSFANFIFVLAVSQFVVDLYALIFVDIRVVQGDLRFAGLHRNIGLYGSYLGVLLLSVFLYWKYFTSVQKLILFPCVISFFLFLFLNSTLKVFLSFFIAYMIVYAVYRKGILRLIAVSVTLLVVPLIMQVDNARLNQLQDARINPVEIAETGHRNSSEWRLLHWYNIVKKVNDEARFKGFGLGQEYAVHTGFYMADGSPLTAHSDVIKFYMEVGPLILLILVVVLSVFITRSMGLLVKRGERKLALLLMFVVINGVLGTAIFGIGFYLFLIVYIHYSYNSAEN